MPRTRKNYPPSLTAKVALEAIKAHKTTAQIAQIFPVKSYWPLGLDFHRTRACLGPWRNSDSTPNCKLKSNCRMRCHPGTNHFLIM